MLADLYAGKACVDSVLSDKNTGKRRVDSMLDNQHPGVDSVIAVQ